MTALSWRALLAEVSRRIEPADARLIVGQAAGYEGAELTLHLDEPVAARAHPYVLDLVARRAAGEPLQYVLGRWAFRRLDLFVDRRVLIPRPETEVVAGLAIEVALDRSAAGGRPVCVDLGTGSGAIGLSVADEVARARVWAVDRSREAVAVARANLAGLGAAAARVSIDQGDWYGALPDELRGRVDVVVSNPPYVAADEVLPAEVADWEPPAALVPGPTGLEAIEAVVGSAPVWLAPAGAVVVEHAPHQAEAVAELCAAAGLVDVVGHDDLAGRRRATVAVRPA